MRQRRARQAERTARRSAVAFARWMQHRGLTRSATARRLGLSVSDEDCGRKYQRALVSRHSPAAEPALILDVQVFDLLRRGVPQVDRLAQIVRMPLTVYRVPVPQELAVVDPAEAVFIGLLAIGQGALPAVPAQERQRLKLSDRLRAGLQRKEQERPD